MRPLERGLWNRRYFNDQGMTPAKMQVVFANVMRKCDVLDGLKDGLIDDPRRCSFDPVRDVPRCAPGKDDATCLTTAQAEGLGKVYGGPRKSDGSPIFVEQAVGAEHPSTYSPFMMKTDGSQPILPEYADSWARYVLFADPDYDPSTYDFDRDPIRGAGVNEIWNPKPNLDAFRARGGRMITYWGWSDTALNPQMGLRYYNALTQRYGGDTLQSFYRFFLVPGVAHCDGGYGPGVVDSMTAVIDWVEAGIAPDRLLAQSPADAPRKYKRAYCPFPQRTRYKGTGNPEDPANFECTTPA